MDTFLWIFGSKAALEGVSTADDGGNEVFWAGFGNGGAVLGLRDSFCSPCDGTNR